MANLTELTAAQLAREIAAGQAGASQAVREYLDAIRVRDPAIGAYNQVLAEGALKRAGEIDSARTKGEHPGPLAGVPVAIKDNLATDYGFTTCSSAMLSNYRSPFTATAVSKLQNAGAVVLGKTNLDEFAMGSSTENSYRGPTKNPWDLSRVPGGSSGGSAAAVSARLAASALGSDTGGSIRQPAAFCGVAGLKPTYGRVSRYGLVAFGSSLDQVGPIGRDVTDCALVLGVIAGGDSRDSTCLESPCPNYLDQLDRPVENLRIGLVREFIISDAIDGEIRSAILMAAQTYEKLGARIVDVDLPHSRIETDAQGRPSSYAVACYYIVAMAEASSNLARYDGVHFGHRTARPVEDIIDLYSKTRAEGFGPEVQRRVMLGTYALSAGYYDAYYNKALKVRRLIKNDFDLAFGQVDVLLCPTAPTTAFGLGEKTADPLTMYLADIYTISANLAGLPGLSIPAGLSAGGLPIGMQLIGPVLSEHLLLRTARMYEIASGVCNLAPPPAQQI